MLPLSPTSSPTMSPTLTLTLSPTLPVGLSPTMPPALSPICFPFVSRLSPTLSSTVSPALSLALLCYKLCLPLCLSLCLHTESHLEVGIPTAVGWQNCVKCKVTHNHSWTLTTTNWDSFRVLKSFGACSAHVSLGMQQTSDYTQHGFSLLSTLAHYVTWGWWSMPMLHTMKNRKSTGVSEWFESAKSRGWV